MFEEASQSLKAYLYDRTESPLFGAFIASWILWNHRLLFVLFSDKDFSDKFQYVDSTLYPSFTVFGVPLDGFFHPEFHLYPLMTAVFLLWGYPYPAKKVFSYWKSCQIDLKHERQKLENEELLSKEDAHKLRTSMREQATTHRTEISEKDKEISDKDKQISDQKTELTNLKEKAEARAASLPTDQELKKWLTQNNFVLVFQPRKGSADATGSANTKDITFLKDGEVGKGKNQHENKWRVTEGKLEIINDKGAVFSTFTPMLNEKLLIDEANTTKSFGRCLVQGDSINAG